MNKKNNIYDIFAIIICILPVVIGFYLLKNPTSMNHTKFHIYYVLGSSLISMLISIIAYIEFVRSRESCIFYVCLGFIGVSIFYGFHGLVTPGDSIFIFQDLKSNLNAFVFFGDVSRVWLAFMLFVPRLIKRKETIFYKNKTIFLICIFLIASSLLLIYNPAMIPNAKDLLGKDTIFSVLIKFITLTLLGISAINYFESYRISSKLQTLTLLVGVVLVMYTVIIFLTSVPWGSGWWLAHNLYLMTFLIIGFGILTSLKDKKNRYFNVWNEVDEYLEVIVNKNKNLEQEVTNLDYLANHDYLTGLFNRTYFMQFVDDFITKIKINNSEETFGILFIDLDGFKDANDRYGHHVGDELLKIIAKMLVDSIREVDVVSRFGGDEFIVFLNNISREHIVDIIKRILISFREPIVINQHNIMIGVSIGVSMFPRNGENAQVLINKSDMSMYKVKRSGKNDYSFYEE